MGRFPNTLKWTVNCKYKNISLEDIAFGNKQTNENLSLLKAKSHNYN